MVWAQQFILGTPITITAIDPVIAVIIAEGLILTLMRRKNLMVILLGLLPGLCLMLALRASLSGAGWPVIALWVSASFPLHLADLRNRLK